MRASLALALLLLALLTDLTRAEPEARRRWTITPTAARGPEGEIVGNDALWRAIERAAPGDVLDVEAGQYAWGALGQNGRGPAGTRAQPITVRARGPVLVRAQDWGGGATLSVHRGHWVTFEGFTFQASGTGIFFHPNFPGGLRGWHFVDCEIDGLYDWRGGRSRHPRGVKSKWGISSWGLGDFLWEGGAIRDTHWEHGMYHHNPVGPITVRDATFERLGRTAIQVRCPIDEAGQRGLPAGRGRFTVERCTIRDVGLADGGSALTLAGRNSMPVNLVGNRIEFGFDRALRAAWERRHPNRRFGSGAVAIWSERAGWVNGPLRLVDNTVRYAEGCGDRAALLLGSAPRLLFARNTVEVADNEGLNANQLTSASPRREPWRRAVRINPRDPDAGGARLAGFEDIPSLSGGGNRVQGLLLVNGRPTSGGGLSEEAGGGR